MFDYINKIQIQPYLVLIFFVLRQKMATYGKNVVYQHAWSKLAEEEEKKKKKKLLNSIINI